MSIPKGHWSIMYTYGSFVFINKYHLLYYDQQILEIEEPLLSFLYS